DRGDHFVDPGIGYQACGEIGVGRLAEPEEIVARAISIITNPESQISNLKSQIPSPESQVSNPESQDFTGEHVVITAGPTVEDLDPVRFITNRSSGRMGYAIAEAARDRGARVTLIAGPTRLASPNNVETIDVRSTHEMYEAVMGRLEDATV